MLLRSANYAGKSRSIPCAKAVSAIWSIEGTYMSCCLFPAWHTDASDMRAFYRCSGQ